MKNKSRIEENSAHIVPTINICKSEVFFDHARKVWSEYGDITFTGRKSALNMLTRSIKTKIYTGEPILLVGGAGHGKSTLIHKVLRERLLKIFQQTDSSMTYQYLNLRVLGPIPIENRFFEAVNRCLLAILFHYNEKPNPCATQNIESADTFRILSNHLLDINLDIIKSNKRLAIMVIDDIDYVEYEYHQIIFDHLRKLFSSPNVMILWACRFSAYTELFYELYGRPVHFVSPGDPIELSVPNIRQKILGRIWPFIDASACSSDIVEDLEPFCNSSRLRKFPELLLNLIKEKIGLEQFIKIPYPFEEWEDFIFTVSNGDLRIVFGIVNRVVETIQRNLSKFPVERDTKGNILPLKICRSEFLKIIGMHNDAKNPEFPAQEKDLWKIINLFEECDQTNRVPLYVNVLQWLVIGDGRFEDSYLKAMRKMGFSYKQALRGFDFCRDARLIEPVVIRTGPYLTKEEITKKRRSLVWQLTLKGSFYLKDLVKWPEYIFSSAFQNHKCLFDELPNNRLHYDTIEYFSHLVMADDIIYKIISDNLKWGGKPGYLQMEKDRIIDLFMKIYSREYRSKHWSLSGKPTGQTNLTIDMVKTAFTKSFHLINNKKQTLATLNKRIKIKRQLVRYAADNLHLSTPNHGRINVKELLQYVYNEVWRDKLEFEVKKGEISHEKILEEALRIFQK